MTPPLLRRSDRHGLSEARDCSNRADGGRAASPERRLWMAAGAGLLALTAGRARAQVTSGATSDVVDDAGRTVSAPTPARRILAAGAPATVLVLSVAPDRLLGWTTPVDPKERPWLLDRHADLPTLGRLTGRGGTANLETALAARPDLIVDYGSTGATYVSLADRVQRQTGIPYVLLDARLDATPAALRTLGRLSGETAQAEACARWGEQIIATIRARLADADSARAPRVYYARGPLGLQTATRASINAEPIEFVGGHNVAGDAPAGLIQVSVEQVLGWDPEVIVTQDPTFFARVASDSLWRSIRAVRAGRVHLAPAVPFGWIDAPPSANRLLGLAWLAQVLHPVRFPEPMAPLVQAFHRLFYHREPTPAAVEGLLAGSAGARPGGARR